MGVSEIGFPQNVVYKQRIQTSDTLPVTIGASKYCEFLFDIDAGDRMTPLGIVGWGCDDKTQVFLLDFYMDTNLQTAKLILKNPYATTIAINSLYIDVLYSKQGLDMSEVDVVDNLTTDSAVAALSARQGKVLNEEIDAVKNISSSNYCKMPDGTLIQWGIANVYTAGATKDVQVTMPIPFTSTYTVVANGQVGSDTINYEVIIVIQPNSASQFTAHIRNTTSTYTRQFYWLAIGRWK